MGLEIESIRLLIHAKRMGVNFTKMVSLGRQRMLVKEKELIQILKKEDLIASNSKFQLEKYAASFFQLLGNKELISLDASDYEGANFIHDLNIPIDDSLKSNCDLVFDGGSLEHIFNFPMAIKNCMDLLKVGGHFVALTPTNNFSGHGFYQFSPELFFRVFNASNGFKLKKLFFYTRGSKDEFYEVTDPAKALNRVELVNASPSFLFVIAEKVEEVVVFQKTPQQYDYEEYIWKGKTKQKSKKKQKSFLWLRRIIFKAIVSKLRRLKKAWKIVTKATGTGNPKHFTPLK